MDKNPSGRRVLVVEDEYFLADDLGHALREAGAEVVGPAASQSEAARPIEAQPVHLAVTDINLQGETSFALADLLAERGVALFAPATTPASSPTATAMSRAPGKALQRGSPGGGAGHDRGGTAMAAGPAAAYTTRKSAAVSVGKRPACWPRWAKSTAAALPEPSGS